MSDESTGSDDGDEFTWGVSEPDDDTDTGGSASPDAPADEPNATADEPNATADEPDATDADRSVDRDGSHVHEAGGNHPDGGGEEYEPSLAGVFGANREDEPVRRDLVPESPSLENALFVLVGVLLGIFVVYEAATTFGV